MSSRFLAPIDNRLASPPEQPAQEATIPAVTAIAATNTRVCVMVLLMLLRLRWMKMEVWLIARN